MRYRRLALLLATTLITAMLVLGWPSYCFNPRLLPHRLATASADGGSFHITIDAGSRWSGIASRCGIVTVRSHDATTGSLLSSVSIDVRESSKPISANVHIVSTDALCVTFDHALAITSDRGATWHTWTPNAVRASSGELQPALIVAARFDASGAGSAELASEKEPSAVVSRLTTSDFGRTWVATTQP